MKAGAAARAALEAEEARRPVAPPPPPPPVECLSRGARFAVVALTPKLRAVAAKAALATRGRSDDHATRAEPLSVVGWAGEEPNIDDSTAPRYVFLELGPIADLDPSVDRPHPIVDGEPDPMATRIDGLRPATTYLAVLKMTPRTRQRMRRACGKGEGAGRILPPESKEETRAVSFRTPPAAPDAPRPPKVRATRLRGAADIAPLIKPPGSTRDDIGSLAAATRPPLIVTVAVKIAWSPPPDNGTKILGFIVERARAGRAQKRAPKAETAWAEVRVVSGAEREVTDVPPDSADFWWYAATERGISPFRKSPVAAITKDDPRRRRGPSDPRRSRSVAAMHQRTIRVGAAASPRRRRDPSAIRVVVVAAATPLRRRRRDARSAAAPPPSAGERSASRAAASPPSESRTLDSARVVARAHEVGAEDDREVEAVARTPLQNLSRRGQHVRERVGRLERLVVQEVRHEVRELFGLVDLVVREQRRPHGPADEFRDAPLVLRVEEERPPLREERDELLAEVPNVLEAEGLLLRVGVVARGHVRRRRAVAVRGEGGDAPRLARVPALGGERHGERGHLSRRARCGVDGAGPANTARRGALRLGARLAGVDAAAAWRAVCGLGFWVWEHRPAERCGSVLG